MAESSTDVIKRYLADAIATEKNFETQVHGFSKQGEDEAVKAVFRQQAVETKRQCEQLIARLHSVGGTPSAAKDLLGHIFGLSLRSIQLGHEKEERAAQNLTIAYAFQNSKIAMYESLATMADAAGDSETAQIARDIQAEQNAMAKAIWDLLTPAASASRRAVSGPEPGHTTPIT
jgi:ferritin-like metal-binding protein YciE